MRFSTRIWIITAASLLSLLIMGALGLYSMRENMMEGRKQQIMQLLKFADAQLRYFHEQEKNGKLTREEAQAKAKEAIGSMHDGNDYFFVRALDTNVMLVHPIASRVGKADNGGKMADGRDLVTVYKEALQASSNGKALIWGAAQRPDKKEDKTLYPKLSGILKFEAWNWMAGIGFFVDDINDQFWKEASIFIAVAGVLLIALSGLVFGMRNALLRQLGGEPAEAAAIMKQVADGDLSASITNPPPNSLLNSLNTMVGSLREIMGKINEQARSVASNVETISASSQEVASTTHQQADATSSMAAAIEEMTVSFNFISTNAKETEGNSREAANACSQGTEQVLQARASMERIAQTVTETSGLIHALNERSQQVSSIAGVIRDIAGQTNLLALNAAIEAARAGEAGRGFAVVADEVRKLSERTSVSTTDIENMLEGIQADTEAAVAAMASALPEVEQGVRLSSSVTDSLRSIEGGARNTLERVAEIALSTHEQSEVSTSIAKQVEEIALTVEETSRSMSSNASSARNLEQVAANLQLIVGRFRLG